MDSGPTAGSITSKGKKPDKTRRSWTATEEEVLLLALKDVITKGWKSENGFRACYLPLLEVAMNSAFPSTDLRANPHINSKIHVWKKQYGCLATMLPKSGVGWNDTENMIDVTNEAWEALVKVDNSVRIMRYKRWPHYQDWCEIFGNDRATGEHMETFAAAVQDVLYMNEQVPSELNLGMENMFREVEGAGESPSVTHMPSVNIDGSARAKSKKRKQVNEVDTQIVAAINNLADITKETMSELIKEIASESKVPHSLDSVLDTLGSIPELTSDEKVHVAELLVTNPAKLHLFLRLGHEDRLSLIRRLLNP